MGVRCIARREGDSLSCATANLVPFTNCRPAASPGPSVPSLGQLHQSGTGMVTSWAPHSANTLPPWGEAPSTHHTFTQPHTSTSTLGLILSPSSDPIPHRLVSHIQAREFVEMRDLLADNISLHNQLEDFHGHIWPSTPAHLRRRCPLSVLGYTVFVRI